MPRDDIVIALETPEEEPFDVDAVLLAHQRRDKPRQDIQALKNAVDRYLHERYSFQPLDFVTWKPLMRNRGFPLMGQAAIFVRWLPEIIESLLKTEQGLIVGVYPADIEVAFLDNDGDLLFFITDSWRWMPWEAQ